MYVPCDCETSTKCFYTELQPLVYIISTVKIERDEAVFGSIFYIMYLAYSIYYDIKGSYWSQSAPYYISGSSPNIKAYERNQESKNREI